MGVAFVQSLGSGGGTGSVAITVGANTTVGNMVSVGFRTTGGTTVTGISDTAGNTWTIDSQSGSTQANTGLASCIVAAGKQIVSGNVITVTGTGNNMQANATEYSGVAVSGGNAVVDITATPVHVSAASVTVATTVNSAAGDLVLTGAAGSVNNAVLTLTAADPDSGGTWTDLAYTGADAGYQIGAASASLYSATWAETSATNMSAVIVSYTAASGGAVSGPFTPTLPAPATGLAATVNPAGPFTITLPSPATSLAGSVTAPVITGTLAVNLPPLVTSLAATPGRELLLSMAGSSGTDDYGNAFPQGVGLYAAGQLLSYTGNPASGDLAASLAAAAGTDAYGNTVIAGLALGAGSAAQVLIQLTSAAQTVLKMPTNTSIEAQAAAFYATGGTTYSLLQLEGPGISTSGHTDSMLLQVRSGSTNGVVNAALLMTYVPASGTQTTAAQLDEAGFNITCGSINAVKPGTGTSPTNAAQAETWHSMSLDTNWTGGGYYRLLGNGDVELGGTVTGSAPNSSSNIATLPSGYQPANTCSLKVLQTSGSYTDVGIQVSTAGVISKLSTAGSGSITISLDGVSIPLTKP